jgi:hypothetical protein
MKHEVVCIRRQDFSILHRAIDIPRRIHYVYGSRERGSSALEDWLAGPPPDGSPYRNAGFTVA